MTTDISFYRYDLIGNIFKDAGNIFTKENGFDEDLNKAQILDLMLDLNELKYE